MVGSESVLVSVVAGSAASDVCGKSMSSDMMDSDSTVVRDVDSTAVRVRMWSMCRRTTRPSSKVTWYDKGPCALRIVPGNQVDPLGKSFTNTVSPSANERARAC